MANYCTLDEIKAELDITSEDKDDVIQTDIEAASEFIDKEVPDREFTATTGIRYFDGGATVLFIDDAVSISKLELDENADGVVDATMATTDYILYPLNKTPKTRIEISNNSDYSGFASGVKQGAKVTGSWGYAASVPKIVKRATIIQVCRWFKRRETAFQDAVGSPEIGQLIMYKGLDPDLAEIIRLLRKRSYP